MEDHEDNEVKWMLGFSAIDDAIKHTSRARYSTKHAKTQPQQKGRRQTKARRQQHSAPLSSTVPVLPGGGCSCAAGLTPDCRRLLPSEACPPRAPDDMTPAKDVCQICMYIAPSPPKHDGTHTCCLSHTTEEHAQETIMQWRAQTDTMIYDLCMCALYVRMWYL